eukprot:65254_1
MCTNEASWISSLSCPINATSCGSSISTPDGMDKNNYIIIEHDWVFDSIDSIHKYNIDTNKWNTVKFTNNIENNHISSFSATLDVKKQILFLFSEDYLTQIHLNT